MSRLLRDAIRLDRMPGTALPSGPQRPWDIRARQWLLRSDTLAWALVVGLTVLLVVLGVATHWAVLRVLSLWLLGVL